MTRLSLNLRPRQPITTSIESAGFVLLLGNFGQDDIPIPRQWFAGAIIEITGPGGYVNTLHPFGPAAPFSAADDEIFGESERAKHFTIPGELPPGDYHLTAVLPLDPSLSAHTDWFLERPAATPAVIANEHVWLLLSGSRQSTLIRRRAAIGDVSSPEPVFLSSPERVATKPPSARSLSVSADSADSERLAWLQGESAAVFGTTSVLFDAVEFSLPGAASRLLPSVLCDPDGAATIAILSGDNTTVWIYRAAPPVVRDAPRSEADIDEDGLFTPFAEISPPVLLCSLPLPFPSRHLNIALTGAGLCLAAAADVCEGVDLAVARLTASGEAPSWNHVRVDQAGLIDSCDPWMRSGDPHLAVSLLLRAGGGEDVHIALANFAFDTSLRPVWLDGVGRRRLASGDPVSASLSPESDGDWPLAWAAQMVTGRLAGGFLRTNALVRSIQGSAVPAGPLALLASPESLAVIRPHADGELRMDCL